MASSYEKVIRVTEKHLDELGHVNNVVYLQWIQDIAKEHWLSLAPEKIQAEYIWVVLSHSISYKIPCFEGELLKIQTFVGEINGPRWPRFVRIYKDSSKLAVSSETSWCLLSTTTQRPVRIGKDVEAVFADDLR